MRERHDEIVAAGAAVIAVATKADYQARHLTAEGYPFPLLLDPDDTLRGAVGIERLSGRALWDPRGALAYARAWRQARKLSVEWSEADQRPGAMVLDEDLQVVWRYVGARLGDYPTVDQIVGAIP